VPLKSVLLESELSSDAIDVSDFKPVPAGCG
jgi:hypothetical protein